MTRNRIAAICAAFTVLIMAPVLAIVAAGELAYHPELAAAEVLAVSDKPMPAAVEAGEEAQELEDELDAEAYAETYAYYAPSSYYDPEYDDMSDQEYIAWRESGWNYEARNGRYIGKYQMDESRLDGDWSPEHQEEVAEQYMLDRYGSWENARAFWDANGWW